MTQDFYFFPPTEPLQIEQQTFPTVPDTSVGWVFEKLTNPTFDADQNQLGTLLNPVIYEWQLDTGLYGEKVLIKQFQLIIIAINIGDFFDYANLASLTNGLILETERNAVVREFANLKTNVDLVQASTTSGSGDIQQSGNVTQNGQVLQIDYEVPIIADDTFKFRIKVQDDLSLISYQQADVAFITL